MKDAAFRTAAVAILVGAGAGAGCTGIIGDSHESGSGGSGPGASSTAEASPIAHLTSLQYNNTLHDLFAPVVVPDQALPPDFEVEGFTNNAAAQTPSATLIEAYNTAAESVTSAAMVKPDKLLGCSPTSRGEEDACAKTFFAKFAQKAFRRPLASEDLSSLLSFYTATRADGTDFTTAMSLSIESILQSPEFLYRVETGTPGDQKNRRVLTSYEMASRLSYFLWNTMPDDALFASADRDELSTAKGVESAARRLLSDARARDAVLQFHHEWLRFSQMALLSKDTTMFPTWSDATADAMRESADKYVTQIFFGARTLTALLTDDHAYVNDALAPIYGVPSPGGSALQLVKVDATQRSGILTHAGVMASFAHETTDSPVLRGVWMLDRWMCQPPPPRPKNVKPTLPAPNPKKPETTRERFADQHEQGSCAGCHHAIDGMGFGFEHYDAIGQWRTKDMGQPVDASGWFPDSGGDLVGTFDGAVDLGKKLAASKTVQSCVTSQWLRYSLGVDHAGVSDADVQPILDSFVSTGLDMHELVIAVTQSDAFRTRVVSP